MSSTIILEAKEAAFDAVVADGRKSSKLVACIPDQIYENPGVGFK
jgi:hypothetical protein